MTLELPINYRIVVQIGKTEFISKPYTTLTKAKWVYGIRVRFISRFYRVDNGQFILNHLRCDTFSEYNIPENGAIIEESKELTGNGEYSVALIEDNPEKFCLKSFIKERQSTSYIEFSQGDVTDLYAPLEDWVYAN